MQVTPRAAPCYAAGDLEVQHGVAAGSFAARSALILALVGLGGPLSADAQSRANPPAQSPAQTPTWPTSRFHGVISGATGEPIPCRCRFAGQQFKLGDSVCMSTPGGTMLARCDLNLNNTSWVPTGVPCVVSEGQPPATRRLTQLEPKDSR